MILRRVEGVQVIPRHHVADQLALMQRRQLSFAKRQAHHRQDIGVEPLARALTEEMHVGVAGQRGDDDAVAAGKFTDVEDGLVPGLLAEWRIELVDRIGADAARGEVIADDGVGGARIDEIGPEQEETPAPQFQQIVHRRQRLLLRGGAGVDHVRGLLLALVLAGVE
jgi:hypothetical protein